MKKEHRFRRHLIRMMATVLLVITVFQPVTALAYDIITTQTTVDTTNWEILAGVVTEDVNGSPKEGKRISIDALKTLAGNNGDPGVGAKLLADLNIAEESEGYMNQQIQYDLVLSFPGKVRSGWFLGLGHSDSNEFDESRATIVKDILLYDLNSAYDFVYKGENPDSLEDYRTKMVALLNAVSSAVNNSTGSVNSFSVKLGTSSTVPKVDDPTMDPSDYVVISGSGDEEIFAYRIPKGYVEISGREDAIDDSLGLILSSSEDAAYLTWGEYAYEAFANYTLSEKLGLTSENVYTTEPGALEQILVGAIESLVDGLTSLLGLWSIDELILNAGVRGGAGYVGGIFPASWEPLIWTFFFITEIIALIVLSFAILAGIYKRAIATVNPIVRASFMEQVKDICIAIFVLILLPIIFRLMISTSATLTEIFTSALGDETAKEKFSVLTKSSGLAGCIMQLVYLCSLIYFNFFYYLRSLIVAVIIALSPLLVIAYAVGDNWKNITTESMKTVVSAIFIQPIQALCLVMILLLPVDGRGFQSIVAIYALIPLTNMVRSLVFKGPSGLNMAARAGQQNTMRYMRSAGNVAAGAALGAAGAIAGGIALNKGGSSGRSSEGSSEGTSGAQGESGNMKNGSTKAEEAAAKQTEGKGSSGGQQTAKEGASSGGSSSGSDTQINESGSGENTAANNQGAEGSGSETQSSSGGTSFGRKLLHGAKTVAKATPGVAAGVTLGAIGGGLAQAGFRTNLAQMGKSTFANAISRHPDNRSATENAANQQGGHEQNNGVNGNGEQHDLHKLTPLDIGRNYADGTASMDAIDSLKTTDYSEIDGMRTQEDDREGPLYQANSQTMDNMGMYVSKPDNIAPEGEKPKWNENSDRTITYMPSKLGERDQANLAAAEQAFRAGSPEQIRALRSTGIKNVTATYQKINGQKKPVEYKVQVSDAKAFDENYGININDKWKDSSGKIERGSSFTGGSITPNIIDNPNVSYSPPSRSQPAEPAPPASQTAPSATADPQQQTAPPDNGDALQEMIDEELSRPDFPEQNF